ncbi:MAG: EAL domain-containing protein [Spirochaetes bacterium]|nr:EAL domain-containing protein [Spirochaetota bacterium]
MELREKNQQILKDKVNLQRFKIVMRTSAQNIFANFLAATFFLFFFWNTQPEIIKIWYACVIIIYLIRLITHLIYLNKQFLFKHTIWKNLFVLQILISGFFWTILMLFLFPNDSLAIQMLFAFVFAGICSGAVSSLSAIKRISLMFVVILLVPLGMRLLMVNQLTQQLLAGIVLALLILQVIAILRINKTITQSIETQVYYEIATDQLQISEKFYGTIFESAPVGIFKYNTSLVIEDCNDKFATILSVDKDKINGLSFHEVTDRRILPAIQSPFNNKIGFYEGEYKVQLSNKTIWLILRTAPILNKDGLVISAVGIVEDLTEQRDAHKRIEFLAYHDLLTHLPNRILLTDRLNQAAVRTQRHPYKGALLFLDLDRFKNINDSLGHQIGDLLIQKVARRIMQSVRKEDTVSRVGADEFVILLPELSNDNDIAYNQARIVCNKIHNLLKKPFRIKEYLLHTSACIGVTIFTEGTESADDILRHADTAMNQAKKNGQGSVHFYHKEMDILMRKRLALENDLRTAITKEELMLYYQPIVAIESNEIIGAEILLRWKHPQYGFIFPIDFINIAEDTGLISPIGDWVINTACKQLAIWQKNNQFALKHLSINISPKQLKEEHFYQRIMDIIKLNQVDIEPLVFEVTESIFIDDFDNIVKKMKSFRNAGIHFSIDDFGTGYSSLSYLRTLPLDYLKIDREFIKDVTTDKNSAAIVETMLDIATHFQLQVVAEGVETEEHVQYLKNLNCPYFQGHYCQPALPVQEFEELFQ